MWIIFRELVVFVKFPKTEAQDREVSNDLWKTLEYVRNNLQLYSLDVIPSLMTRKAINQERLYCAQCIWNLVYMLIKSIERKLNSGGRKSYGLTRWNWNFSVIQVSKTRKKKTKVICRQNTNYEGRNLINIYMTFLCLENIRTTTGIEPVSYTKTTFSLTRSWPIEPRRIVRLERSKLLPLNFNLPC